MKEVLAETGATTRVDLSNAQWYQAATLNERIPLFLKKRTPASSTGEAESGKAELRLKYWKDQPPFHKSANMFLQRLEQDGLEEEDLLALLAQPAEELQASFAEPPAWLVEFAGAFEHYDPSVLANLPLESIDDRHTYTMVQAIKPLLARGFARLQTGIAELRQRYSTLPFRPETAGTLLLPHFLSRLLNKLTKTMVLELNVARVQGRLQGETPEQRFLYFLQQLTRSENLLSLFEEYPVLARLLVEMTDRWVVRSLELLQRLCADWDEIRGVLGAPGDPGTLIEIQEGKGDAHQGGRTVTILAWSSGFRLVYKPRPLTIDVHFQELLTWLNANGCRPAFHMGKLINKGTYGWCEFLPVEGCATREEVERFYQRLGGYLAILYILEGTDFHAENLLASGEHPMLIDLESLFQPRLIFRDELEGYGYNMLTHSVRRTGLIPSGNWFNGEGEKVDLSGIVGKGGKMTSAMGSSLVGQSTDEVSIKKEQAEIRFNDHRPTLQGEEVDPLAYEAHIIAGFTTVYRLLLQKREEFLSTILPRFADDQVRVLLRQTQQYTLLLADASHPNVLRDALDRDRLFDRLWISVESDRYLARAIAAERADLLDGDVPKFTAYPGSRDLFTSRGEKIADFFQESSMEMARERAQGLSEKDLERQVWITRAAFACFKLNNTSNLRKEGLQLRPPASMTTRDQFLTEAVTIGNSLEQLAWTRKEMVGWLSLDPTGGQEWRTAPAGPDLYNGIPGIALFLAYLGIVSGEERFTNLARLAARTLRTVFWPKTGRWYWKKTGAFDGLGSLIYLFSHLGSIWHDTALYQEAEELLPALTGFISQDDAFDLIAGNAGCIAALLSLYEVAPSEATLAAAIQCGDHLLSRARTMPQGIAWSAQPERIPLAGISHGNAGIALSLFRLAAASQEERFYQAALAALEYERSIFSEEKQNWPDLREALTLPDASNPASKFMSAWCHGAPGVGLARLASLRYHDDAAIRKEVQAAIATTVAEGFGRNHSLCHGDMGNLELLLLATELLPTWSSREGLEPLMAALLENMREQGWQSGISCPVELPGLMLGIAGTGYELLRLVAPEHVPSVLVLEPPKTR